MDYWSRKAPKVPRVLIENAVPLEAIDAAVPAETARPTGLYAGRLVTLKNVDVALAAAAEVMRERDFDLVLCGEGPERGRLEQRARELGIAERVRFAGFVPDVAPAMKAARFFVSLSDFEGNPNAVLEAFAAGTPSSSSRRRLSSSPPPYPPSPSDATTR